MPTASKTFLDDCRGATMPEYGLVLFAVLLVGAVAMRALGNPVQHDADVTQRILGGEDIRMTGGGTSGPGGSVASGAAAGEGSGAAGSESNGAGGSAGGGAGGTSGGALASAGGSSIGSSAGGSSGAADPSVAGGGIVLGASGASTTGSAAAGGGAASGSGEAAGADNTGSTVGSLIGGGAEAAGAGGGVVGNIGGAIADSAHGSGPGSSSGGSSASGGFGSSTGFGSSSSSAASSASSGGGKSILGAILSAIFGDDSSSSSSSSESSAASTSASSKSGGGITSTSTTRSATTTRGGAIEDKLPGTKTTASEPSKTGVLGASNAPKNNVNPPPTSNETDTRGGVTQTIDGHTFTVSAAGERQMAALAAKASANAGAKRPKGWCYHQVKVDIQEVGYGDISKQTANAQLRPLPGSDQGEAHDFADYMNARASNGHTNADNLGLQKLSITNPYDAPKGAIIVVRAGTPGTHNPTAGDIVVAGGNGKFYNDGNMGYGGSKNFKPGNNYVLGIYVPK